jgi:tRNA-2-methylthio-N6-dimethylallyladenosine synthase
MEKIIEEGKQGEALVLENKAGNTKKPHSLKVMACYEFSDSEIVALFYRRMDTTQLKHLKMPI